MSVAATGRTTGSTLPEMDISFLLVGRRDLRRARIDLDLSVPAAGAHARVDGRTTVSRSRRHRPGKATAPSAAPFGKLIRAARDSKSFPVGDFSARCLWTERRVVPQIGSLNERAMTRMDRPTDELAYPATDTRHRGHAGAGEPRRAPFRAEPEQ